MTNEVKNFFTHLNLVREDLQEEFRILGIKKRKIRICDYGCGTGLTTFGLAIEVQSSECFGLDMFTHKFGVNPNVILGYIGKLQREEHSEIFDLVESNRLPKFFEGNIVKNLNLPNNIDLAYCKKVLMNIYGKVYRGTKSGEIGLLQGIRNITETINSKRLLVAVEYDNSYMLEKYFKEAGLEITKRDHIKRREIRLKGRSTVVSDFDLYLCQKKT